MVRARVSAREKLLEHRTEIAVYYLKALIEPNDHFMRQFLKYLIEVAFRRFQVFHLRGDFVVAPLCFETILYRVYRNGTESRNLVAKCGYVFFGAFKVVILVLVAQRARIGHVVRLLYALLQLFEVGVNQCDIKLLLLFVGVQLVHLFGIILAHFVRLGERAR